MTLDQKIEYLEELGIPTEEMTRSEISVWYERAIGEKLTKEQVAESIKRVEAVKEGLDADD